MNLPKYTKDDIVGKRILMRADLDIKEPVNQYHDLRLERLVPAIQELVNLGAGQVILLGHRGRPNGNDTNLSLLPIKNRLNELYKKSDHNEQIFLIDDINNEPYNYRDKKIIMLENLRFWPGEKNAEKSFAEKLSKWGDVYINNSFGNSHRADASMVVLPSILKNNFAGLGLINEINFLESFIKNIKSPFVVILGGAKIKTKLPLLKNLGAKADSVLVGGALANNIFRDSGIEIGESLVDDATTPKDVLKNRNLILPIDVADAASKNQYIDVSKLGSKSNILDIGSKTLAIFKEKIKDAKTILWNGPMGKLEDKKYSVGTYEVAKAMSNSSAQTLAGGAETVEALEYLNLVSEFNFVSVGGGAMLTFLSGENLPGLEALINN